MPLLSIVIPSFNRAALLEKALVSVGAQDLSDSEVIVVDDGSTDETEKVVRNCEFKIRFERQARKGPGAARNLGWSLASGDYIAFLDSDDVWFPWTLQTYRNCISRYSHPKFVIGNYFRFQADAELAAVQRAPLQAHFYRDYLASADEIIWMGSGGMLLRRDCKARFESKPMNAEDIDLALHLGLEEGFAVIRQPFIFGYRHHGSNAVVNFDYTYRGVLHLIEEEKNNRFPGGQKRQRERVKLITRSTRPPALEALRCNRLGSAFDIYRQTLAWNASLGKWKFILIFPILAFASLFRVRLERIFLGVRSRGPERSLFSGSTRLV
jgi:glycosyltransferase involved in cell wall biosynthesis